MDVIDKIKAEAVKAWAAIQARFNSLEPPALRLAVACCCILLIGALAVRLLPLLILLALIGAATWFALRLVRHSDDEG